MTPNPYATPSHPGLATPAHPSFGMRTPAHPSQGGGDDYYGSRSRGMESVATPGLGDGLGGYPTAAAAAPTPRIAETPGVAYAGGWVL
jgi:hypothetical protein